MTMAMDPMTVTAAARAKILEFQAADAQHGGKAFRITVDSGGCSGYQYDFSFDMPKPGDTQIMDGPVCVVIDAQSLPIVTGSVLDYVDEFQGSGFTVNNPNSTESCGCGKSFGVG